MAQAKRFSDLDYRLRKLSSGDVAQVYDDKAINQALKNLLMTVRGERFFNPEFGTRVPELLFEQFDPITGQVLHEEIKMAIETWEPRIELLDISIQMDYDSLTYILDVAYRIKSTAELGNLNLNLVKQ